MLPPEKPDYTTVTELPGGKILPLQLKRLYQRYKFAAVYCQDRDVLEVGCGSGTGLGILARTARSVIAGDIEEGNLKYARETYQNQTNVKIMRLDAHCLNFPPLSFDVILLFEAIYYLQSPELFLNEARKILKPKGKVIICTANKDWPDFNPSPFSTRYFSVPEMSDLFASHGFRVNFFAAFPDHHDTLPAKVKSLIKRTAVKFHLMPKTMRGKAALKKFFFGKLVDYPGQLTENITEYIAPQPIPENQRDCLHTAIFAVAEVV